MVLIGTNRKRLVDQYRTDQRSSIRRIRIRAVLGDHKILQVIVKIEIATCERSYLIMNRQNHEGRLTNSQASFRECFNPQAGKWMPSLIAAGIFGAIFNVGAALATSASGSADDAGPTDQLHHTAQLSCDSAQTASSYVANPTASIASTPASGSSNLLPCLSVTGYGTSESAVGIASDGTVYIYPGYVRSNSDGVGVMRSTDSGASWDLIVPEAANHQEALHRGQPFMYLDPTTDKMFLLSSFLTLQDPLGTGFRLYASDDAAKTWDYSEVAKEGRDWIKMLSGPPVTSQTQGYPNVLYLSLPTPISTPVTLQFFSIQLPQYQQIYRSLDGGKSWQAMGQLLLKTRAVPDCANTEFILYGNGVVGSDGTIYLGLRRCSHLGIAVSHDEGATWTVADVPNTSLKPISNILQVLQHPEYLVGEPFTMDGQGNLYAVWTGADQLLHQSVTRDKGATWSTPVVVSSPEVDHVRFSAVNLDSKGRLAIAYYGSSDGGFSYDGYVTESNNPLDSTPAFRQVMVNPPDAPLFPRNFDAGYIFTLFGGNLYEYLQVKSAPNGDLWASFVRDMCPGQLNARCTWSRYEHESGYQSTVAHIVHR